MAPAQERDAGEELEDAVGDILHVWSQPARIGTDDLPGLGVVAGATALTFAVDDDVDRWVVSHPHAWPTRALAPFRDGGRLASLGRTDTLLPASTALWLTGLIADEPGLRDAGTGCAAANLATTLSRHVMGRVSGRMRPPDAEGPLDFEPLGWAAWKRRSFPSGHSSNAMSCATFLAHRFDLGAGEALLYAVSVGIGLGRVADRAHWLSDSLLGLAWGWAVGRVVADRYEERTTAASGGNASPLIRLSWTVRIR